MNTASIYTLPGNIIGYFKSKEAIDESSAVNVPEEDWLIMGFNLAWGGPKSSHITKLYPFIKQTSDGRYWFDKNGVETFKRNQANFFWAIIIFCIVLPLITLLVASIFNF